MKRNRPKGFFITGTDTDIGKTYISKVLADSISKRHQVTYMKPIQTGCVRNAEGKLSAPDFDYVMSGSSVMTGPYDTHVPYRFEPACSPHLAATLASETISLEYIRDCLHNLDSYEGITLVEGAGGVLVPLSQNMYTVDLIQHLQLPVILVTSPHLGTLNHTFLSIKELHAAGLTLAGVVLNNCRNVPENFIYQDNRRMIRDYILPVPFLEIHYGITKHEQIDQFSIRIEHYL